MCPGYNSAWIKGFYNFRDFGQPEVKKSVDMLLDFYWAYWAQEQLNGVEGGGKTRIRGVNGFSHETHGIPALGWLYFEIGENPTTFSMEINAMLSDYRPPVLVAAIAHSARDNGPYEIRQRAQGLGKTGVASAAPTDNMHGGPMIVWMPEEGMKAPVREGDLVFVETEGAYAVIRVVGSEFELTDKQVSNPSIEGPVRIAPPGRVVIPDNEYAPVILEVMARTQVKDFAEFKQKAKACEVKMQGSVLNYTSLYGDRMTFDSSYNNVPTINGKPVDYSPPNVHESPFLNSVYDSGVVTIRYGDLTKVLDFDNETSSSYNK